MSPRPSPRRTRSVSVRRARSASVRSPRRARSAPAALGHGPTNTQLMILAEKLNEAYKHLQNTHNAQKARLKIQATEMGALHNNNYREAREAALAAHKRSMRRLHPKRNQLVYELLRNYRSTPARRHLYAEGMRRAGYTSQNNWQNWTNKLWWELKK